MWPLNICIQVCAASEGDGDRAEYHDSANDGQAVKKSTVYTSTVGMTIKAVPQENTSGLSYRPTFSQTVTVYDWHRDSHAEEHGRRRPPPIRTNAIWASKLRTATMQKESPEAKFARCFDPRKMVKNSEVAGGDLRSRIPLQLHSQPISHKAEQSGADLSSPHLSPSADISATWVNIPLTPILDCDSPPNSSTFMIHRRPLPTPPSDPKVPGLSQTLPDPSPTLKGPLPRTPSLPSKLRVPPRPLPRTPISPMGPHEAYEDDVRILNGTVRVDGGLDPAPYGHISGSDA